MSGSGTTREQTGMRVLTVRQPWAWAIIHGNKGVENRVRNIAGDYRGPVAIHAGLAAFEQDSLAGRVHRSMHGTEEETRIDFGAIIGVVNLWAVHPHDGTMNFYCCPNSPDRYGQWALEGVWHLCLSSPRALRKPIPFTGALGLRRLDATTITKIESELS